MLVRRRLGTTKAVTTIMAEITVATTHRNGSTVVATGGISLEVRELAVLIVVFSVYRTGPFQDGIVDTDVRAIRSFFRIPIGTFAILVIRAVSIGSIVAGRLHIIISVVSLPLHL